MTEILDHGSRLNGDPCRWRFTAEEVAQAIADAEPITDHAESARLDWLAWLHELLCDELAARVAHDG